MFKKHLILLAVLPVIGCRTTEPKSTVKSDKNDFVVAFGSCNKQYEENPLWDEVLRSGASVWIWGGDNIYADTNVRDVLVSEYERQKNQPGYAKVTQAMDVIGTWDDHDYGLNDGGAEFDFKKISQELFLDFMNVPADNWRRSREGVYDSKTYDLPEGSIKIIVLDTRFFRTALTPDTNSGKRFMPNIYGQGTILGEKQWEWLTRELMSSEADFNIIVSSIQVISGRHGFETWGNFPHETDRLKKVIRDSKAKGVILLSGDRHISEFSLVKLEGVANPLVDFTSSGLTHTYEEYSGEENPDRVGVVIKEKSFGVLKFNFEHKTVLMQMIGDHDQVLQELTQTY